MYTYINSQRRWHMGNTLEVVFLLLLNIVVNIIGRSSGVKRMKHEMLHVEDGQPFGPFQALQLP